MLCIIGIITSRGVCEQRACIFLRIITDTNYIRMLHVFMSTSLKELSFLIHLQRMIMVLNRMLKIENHINSKFRLYYRRFLSFTLKPLSRISTNGTFIRMYNLKYIGRNAINKCILFPSFARFALKQTFYESNSSIVHYQVSVQRILRIMFNRACKTKVTLRHRYGICRDDRVQSTYRY